MDLSLVDRALAVRIKERDLERFVDEFGEGRVEEVLRAMEQRVYAQPNLPIKRAAAYMLQSLRNGKTDQLFREDAEIPAPAPSPAPAPPGGRLVLDQARSEDEMQKSEDRRKVVDALNSLPPEEIERLAERARAHAAQRGIMTPTLEKRFKDKLYRSPLIWNLIIDAYTEELFQR